jgi:hypothetical protein
MATKLRNEDDVKETTKLIAIGFGRVNPPVLLSVPQLHAAETDPFRWEDYARELRYLEKAHKYIERNFEDLPTGSVVDLDYIEGNISNSRKPELLM